MRVKTRSTTLSRAERAGNERTHLRENHDQRGLAQVSGLAAHVRPGQQQNCVRGRIQVKIVGDEALAASSHFLLLDYRMAALDDLKIASFTFCRSLVRRRYELRPAVISQRRDVRERSQHVDLGQRQRGLTDSLRLGRDCSAQLGEQAALDLDDLFLRVENLGFVLFQFGRGEALRAYQSLFAFVILRDQVQIRLRYFDVVTEDGIELYFERTDPRAPAFPLLDLRQHLLAVAGEFAQLVQIAIYAWCDHAAVGEGQRRFRHDRCFNAVAQVA